MPTKGLVLLTLLLSPPAFSEMLSYCHDEEAEQGWTQLREKYANTFQSRDVEYLYSLRSDICQQVESGGRNIEEAAQYFEVERQHIIEQWRAREIEKIGDAGGVSG